jgi:hypothetical protein
MDCFVLSSFELIIKASPQVKFFTASASFPFFSFEKFSTIRFMSLLCQSLRTVWLAFLCHGYSLVSLSKVFIIDPSHLSDLLGT